jgi:rhomboid protease GluP
MSQLPDRDDERDEALERMRHEFGMRRMDETVESGAGEPSPPLRPDATRAAAAQARIARPAPAQPRSVWIILGGLVLIYILSCLLSGSLYQPSLPVLILLGAKVNDLIAAGEYWRLLTATLLHANLIHIFFNGYALFILGPETERIYGTSRFLLLYWIAGLSGSVASYLFSPNPAVGASGAIFGLIGALGVFFYLSREALGSYGRAQVQNMVAIGAINLLIGFAAGGTIDNFGHIGGMIGGALAGFALAPRLKIDARFMPPVLVRRFPSNGWVGAVVVAVLMLVLVFVLPPA